MAIYCGATRGFPRGGDRAGGGRPAGRAQLNQPGADAGRGGAGQGPGRGAGYGDHQPAVPAGESRGAGGARPPLGAWRGGRGPGASLLTFQTRRPANMATAESRLEAVLLVRACLLPAAAVPPPGPPTWRRWWSWPGGTGRPYSSPPPSPPACSAARAGGQGMAAPGDTATVCSAGEQRFKGASALGQVRQGVQCSAAPRCRAQEAHSTWSGHFSAKGPGIWFFVLIPLVSIDTRCLVAILAHLDCFWPSYGP